MFVFQFLTKCPWKPLFYIYMTCYHSMTSGKFPLHIRKAQTLQLQIIFLYITITYRVYLWKSLEM